MSADMRKREKLYGEFIGECARLLIDAFTHTLEDPEKLLPLYALTNRIRLTASQPVLAEAEHLLKHITEQYFSRNLTVEDMRQLAGSDERRSAEERSAKRAASSSSRYARASDASRVADVRQNPDGTPTLR